MPAAREDVAPARGGGKDTPAGLSAPRHGPGRRPCRDPPSGPRRDRFDFLPLRKTAGCLLRIDEIAIERDLEHPARALDQLDLGAVDPGEPVAHTERFGFISSSAAVFDSELHRLSPAKPPVPGASIHPGRSVGHLAGFPAMLRVEGRGPERTGQPGGRPGVLPLSGHKGTVPRRACSNSPGRGSRVHRAGIPADSYAGTRRSDTAGDSRPPRSSIGLCRCPAPYPANSPCRAAGCRLNFEVLRTGMRTGKTSIGQDGPRAST